MEEKIVLLHGFDQEDVLVIMRAVKAALPAAREAAFATTTPSNLEWKVSDLLEHIAEEHAWFRENQAKS
jgi:hypothetical protein